MRKKDTQYALQVSWQTKRKQLPAAVMHAAPFFSFLLHQYNLTALILCLGR
jgi:hypothetical protein